MVSPPDQADPLLLLFHPPALPGRAKLTTVEVTAAPAAARASVRNVRAATGRCGAAAAAQIKSQVSCGGVTGGAAALAGLRNTGTPATDIPGLSQTDLQLSKETEVAAHDEFSLGQHLIVSYLSMILPMTQLTLKAA